MTGDQHHGRVVAHSAYPTLLRFWFRGGGPPPIASDVPFQPKTLTRLERATNLLRRKITTNTPPHFLASSRHRRRLFASASLFALQISWRYR